jgi:hypothetical protein
MSNIYLRYALKRPLTFGEIDANFFNLNENINNLNLTDLNDIDFSTLQDQYIMYWDNNDSLFKFKEVASGGDLQVTYEKSTPATITTNDVNGSIIFKQGGTGDLLNLVRNNDVPILKIDNENVLTHTFTNTNYSAIGTGYAAEFKRESGIGLRIGSNTTGNIIQSVDDLGGNNLLSINPYGGDVIIGERSTLSNKIVQASSNSTFSVRNGGTIGFSVRSTVGVEGITTVNSANTLGLIFTGNRNVLNAIRNEIRSTATTPYNSLTDNDSVRIGSLHTYLSFGGLTSTSSAVASNIKIQPRTLNAGTTATNLLLSPFGGNIGIGINTSPTATLQIKGNSDTVGELFRAENLSNTASLNLNNDGLLSLVRNAGNNAEYFTISSNSGRVLTTEVQGNSSTLRVGTSQNGIRQLSNGTLNMFGSFVNAIPPVPPVSITVVGTYINQVGQPLIGLLPQALSISPNNGGTAFLVNENPTITLSGNSGSMTYFNIAGSVNQTSGNNSIIGISYNPTLTSILGAHYGLLIRPSTFNGIGLGSTLPTATLHIKGESDSTGNVFRAENLSNTSNYTLANDGTHTLGFSTGGKVLIAGAVGSAETLLEIRRTVSNSGGFIFRSNNGASQTLSTISGSFNIDTLDNSNINLGMGSGLLTVSTNPSMSAINTGQRMMVGTLASSILSRWLNIGYNSTLGQIIQSVQNGSSPTNDRLSLNPYGGNVGVGDISATATLHIKGDSDVVGEAFRVESLTGNRLIIGNDGKHAINTTIDSNFNLKIVGDSGFLYQNTAGTRYIRFRPSIDGNGSEPLDIRTNNTGGNSNILFVRDQGGGVRFKLATASGAGTYLALGGSISESPFGYTAAGIRVHGATLVQGLHNISNFQWNRFAAVGISAHGDFGTGITKQSALSIQSFHTNTDISKQVSMLRLHADTTFTLTAGSTNGIVRGIDMDYTINQTGGSTRFIGIDYQPTLTSILGAHYGLLIRPNTLNGIGLGATLPTATLHIKGDTTNDVLHLIDSNNNEIALVDNIGNLSWHNDAFYVDVINDRVGIGTSTPYASLTVVSQGTSNVRAFVGEHYENTTAFSQFKMIGSRARGNRGNPSAVLANDSLASFNGRGYKTTDWSDTVGGMYVYARENWTDSSTPTFITFRGVNTGTTVEEWVKLNQIGLGVRINPTSTLHVKGDSDVTGTIFKSESLTNEAFRIDSNLNIYSNGLHMFGGSGDIPQAKVDINGANGYDQLVLRTQYTPTNTADPNGFEGTITWDNDFVYVKTTVGWKKSPLITI